MKTFSIGDTLIDLPDFLDARVEDGTLIAYPPQTDFANLRFSIISVRKNEKEVTGAGEQLIRERALKANACLREAGDRVWYQIVEPSSEGSSGSLMHYWYVGMGGYALVVSCFIDADKSNDFLSKLVTESVEPTIQSFRKNESDD